MIEQARHRLAFHGALMLFLGMVYGLYVALVMTDKVPGHGEIALGSHLNALMGAFWLLGMGWSLAYIKLSDSLLKWCVWMTIVGAWANWIISIFKAFTGDIAIEFTSHWSNNVLFGARALLVIIPCLLGPAIWAWGLRHRPSE